MQLKLTEEQPQWGKCTSPVIDAHNQANSTNENTTKEAEEMREHNINLPSRPYISHSPQIEDMLRSKNGNRLNRSVCRQVKKNSNVVAHIPKHI